MNQSTARRLALSLLMCSTATFAYGQDATPFDLGTIRIETADAQAVLGNDEISQEEIENRNAATVADVFSGESAITASGGAPIGQKVFVNGIEESLLSVTIDGARQNKSAFHHTGNVLLDPALLKSVEISAGLAPADEGPNALAGSIAYTTKDARDLLDEGDPFGGMYSFTAGTNGLGFRNTLTLFGQQNGFEYLLSGTRATGDDYEDADGVTNLGTGADLTDYIAKFGFTGQGGERLTFSASQTTDDGLRVGQPGPGGIFFVRPDFAGTTAGPNTLIEALSQRKSYTLTYTDEQPEGWFAPTVQLSYNEQEIDVSGVYGVNKSFSGVFKNEFQLSNGTVNAGLDFFDESAEGFGRGPGAFGNSGREDQTNVGLFAQVRQDLGERVSLSYGARYDWQNFTAADGSEFSDSGASVNGSVDVVLNDNWTLNAGAASSWGGYELGEASLINFGTDWTYAGFTSSRAESLRLGLRFDRGPWSAKAAVFDTKISDLNAVLPSGGDRGALSDVRSRGFDGSVTYTGVKGFATLNYTYADVEVDDQVADTTSYYLGRPLGHIFGLEMGYDVNPEWRVGATAQIALKNEDTATVLPSYEVVDVYAEFKPKNMENLNLRLDVHNLFDEQFSRRSSDGIDNSNVIPLTDPGRTISFTASIKF
ncbi:TonB-dependent receptor domain-containing protein [Sulfitobacter donghicola]|uniref:TonB-dependent receptor n=1 Tax=Sulfitobacter donghicola DSW-25 = KCTC 12864 = JCM 14565 TaxID=1300350 RepID=A0A073IFI2_9RHOB|nr:TonB-dependent receptor [Sulfitobacter donghicola]KEJ88499.1 TonB-dependent receptor [Sulfitobacter donghicola DSW-25 = KCTC 12864 = JCM 14565]KIN69625.1 TonB dependent-iron siderophore receptor [Sulfitobacter donghicola DSW-25 = KCTC 12864 = JCM 14565]